MKWPDSLQIALKEWRTVCDAMGEGRQIIMLRKGGIYEAGGEFEIAHRQFLLFPTYVHQSARMLKRTEQVIPTSTEPDRVEILVAGEITDILPMPSRAAVDALEGQHIWAQPLIDMRFNYRPENPLFLLMVRAYRLEAPVDLENTPAYAGCKSWIPLDLAISTQNAIPAMDEEEYDLRRQTIREAIA